MTNMQIERVEGLLLEVVERYAPTATTAAEVEALAAVAQALVKVHRTGLNGVTDPCGTMVAAFRSAIRGTGVEETTT